LFQGLDHFARGVAKSTTFAAFGPATIAGVQSPRRIAAFGGGTIIGTLGGLIGLGGAEFRLPLLIGYFRFAPLEAIVLNKAMSLLVVVSALVFRTRAVSIELVASHLDVVANLLAGSLIGAWLGASWATRMASATLYRAIAILLVAIAVVLMFGHETSAQSAPISGWQLYVAGAVAGLVIGIVASLMGVAGGELLIPTLVVLFGLDIKLAGSLALAVSLPTMLVGFARYSRDQSFTVLGRHKGFLLTMAIGSIVGTFIGAALLGFTSGTMLYPLLALILVLAAIRVWRHE
jgi:uncharacterized membrane protein YfcA